MGEGPCHRVSLGDGDYESSDGSESFINHVINHAIAFIIIKAVIFMTFMCLYVYTLVIK